MGLACLLRRVLVLGIVTLLFGASWMAVLSGNVSVAAAGATVYVDDDNVAGPWDGSLANPYRNITSGLAHASDGDTVYVFGGTYYESVVVNKSVTLIGDSKPVIDGLGGLRGIDITVNNVTVSGFKITSSGYGIYTNASGFSITNNVFWYSYYQSFHWEIYEGSLAEDYMLYDCTIVNNEFYTRGSEVVYVAVYLDYSYNSGYDIVIGDVTISDNTFHMDGTSTWGINVDDFGVYDLTGGTVSVGVVNMSGNAMYGGAYGIVFYGSFTCLNNTQASLGDVIISNNVMVNHTEASIYVDYYDVENLYGNTIVTLGDLIVTGNAITSAYGAYGIYVSNIGYWDGLTDYASLEVGSVYIEENEIDVGGNGIDLYGYEVGYDLEDYSSFAMGNILVRDNTINSDGEGMYLYFEDFGYEMYGNSSFTMGNTEFSGNTINSGGDGISGYTNYFGNGMYGNSSFSMGNIEITGNTVESVLKGIYLYEIVCFGYEMYDDSSFTMGSILVNDNTVNSDDYGIGPWFIQYFGNGMYGNSSFTMSSIEFCRNVVNSTYDALGFSSFTDFGVSMSGNSSFSMGSILVNDNTLNSYIWLTSFGNFGSGLRKNSSCTVGNVEFCRNKIYTDNADGITFYWLQSFGSDMIGYSLFKMGDFSVNDNVIASNASFSGISCIQPGGFGINVYDNAVAITGSFEFEGNDISFTWNGLYLWMVSNATARNNIIWNSTYGIYIASECVGNHIYHNNLINNTIQAFVTSDIYTYDNTWDDGYPSGGNYWSNYTGTDQYSGPDQNISGSDFRGDTPYVINQNNTDHYPLTIPYETKPPTITILSPENRTYSVYTGIQLTFTLDELPDWMGYSLEDQAVVTIAGNMTLPTLTAGRHHVTVYANDTFDNMGVSTIYFTVLDTTDPIANAGSDRTVNEDVSTTLDGSASTDNVGITGYTWTFTNVTVKTLTGDRLACAFSNPGVYTITLNVTDAAGNWATDTVVITVLDVTKPVANAGNDQTVNVGDTVTFDASSSSDNGGIVSFEWDFGDGMFGTGKTATHDYNEAGTYTVTLTVKDAAGNQATDTVVVTVNAAEAFPWWIVAAAAIIAAGVVVAVVILWRRRKKTAQ